MISDKRLQKLIDDCSEAFVGTSSKKDVVEPGLYSEWLESHQLQIKKACRLIGLGAKAGIYTKETGEMLISLWNLNRSNVYYRRGLPTKDAAEDMVSLVISLHSHVLGLNKNLKKECIC